ncbi:hypothetical protein GCM10025867_46400 (plasmid) [Frondihabitans sucicola]|uniref:YlxR family protein n=1 Tax=Frondihabitans sucicola TaxID=1268041 RepID=A0ABM8GVA4_9MICO|nr:hypothetical protein [Frondihabitans sucicola]BDZ52399.1 hypothetical protein GCM10025867_46400 [Frondihabitans sucicola]
MAARDPDPICKHRDSQRRVTNQPGDYNPNRPHRSTWVCARRACVLDAMAWVERGTAEKAFVFDTNRQMVDA